MHGHGSVFLIDKAHHVVTQLADLLDLDPARIDRSPCSLAAANGMLRAKDRPGVVDEFFRVSGYTEGRERAELFRVRLREDPVVNSVLDPLVPAMVAAVRHWGPVTVVHDRQIMLPARRIVRIQELCEGRPAGVRFADAGSHPQVQIADILAGTVRHIAERSDPVLIDLIGPYVDPQLDPGRLRTGSGLGKRRRRPMTAEAVVDVAGDREDVVLVAQSMGTCRRR